MDDLFGHAQRSMPASKPIDDEIWGVRMITKKKRGWPARRSTSTSAKAISRDSAALDQDESDGLPPTSAIGLPVGRKFMQEGNILSAMSAVRQSGPSKYSCMIRD
ncbi:MAG: hypothetical protein ABL904_01965 [Hyphomicrobiaceae bacterium]